MKLTDQASSSSDDMHASIEAKIRRLRRELRRMHQDLVVRRRHAYQLERELKLITRKPRA